MKIRIFKSNVLSVLLYGSECWKITKTIENKLNSFQTKCLRRIRQLFWPNTIRNNILLAEMQMKPLTTIIEERRWRWLGHVLRMTDNSLPKIALRWTPQGNRSKGRPKETWRRTTERMLSNRGLTWARAEKKAKDRHLWKTLVEAPCALGT